MQPFLLMQCSESFSPSSFYWQLSDILVTCLYQVPLSCKWFKTFLFFVLSATLGLLMWLDLKIRAEYLTT